MSHTDESKISLSGRMTRMTRTPTPLPVPPNRALLGEPALPDRPGSPGFGGGALQHREVLGRAVVHYCLGLGIDDWGEVRVGRRQPEQAPWVGHAIGAQSTNQHPDKHGRWAEHIHRAPWGVANG